MMALLRASEKVEALERQGVLVADVASIVRSLATIAYATFDPNGFKILDRLAGILGGNPAQPVVLLDHWLRRVATQNTCQSIQVPLTIAPKFRHYDTCPH